MDAIRLLAAFATAALWPGVALAQHSASRWVDGTVAGPFVVRAEFSLGKTQRLPEELAQLQRDLQEALGIAPAGERIEVYLLRDKASYSRFLEANLPEVPYRRALYVKQAGPGKVLTYWSPQLATDLRHECTHALLHAALPMVPLWLDEGLAEYFEVPADQRAFDNPHLGSLRWNLMLGILPNLASLEKKTSLSQMGKSEYRDAWAWVHFMLLGPAWAHDELVGYLADIRASAPPGRLSERLERRAPRARQQLAAHFRSWRR